MLNDEVIAEVVAGPLEGFVARRDALAKELKAAGEAEDSAAVKRLRKPSRQAWALDAAARQDSDAIERVAAAVHAVVEAQDGRGDMRDATRTLRDAVHAAAGVAAGAATDAGLSVQRADLVPALMAVVGDAAAFDRLRKAQLTEIPAAGGFEPAPLTRAPRVGLDGSDDGPDAVVTPLRPRDEATVERARDAVARMEQIAADTRGDAETAEQEVADASAAVEAAEEALHQAETEARHAADRLRIAKRAAKTARDTARQAERNAAGARAKLQEVEG